MKIDTFLCQLVLATLANTIAGFINRNSRDQYVSIQPLFWRFEQ